MKLVLIGAGQRGRTYTDMAFTSGRAQVVAIVEPHEGRREDARIALDVPQDMCFETADGLWAKERIADAAIIASMDRDHYEQTMKALDLGYDILLEKPISPSPAECVAISRKAQEKGCMVAVCHVLRYTAFFSTIKRILDSGELGKVITIQHNENIGNFHIAHSFVRGNWRNAEISSPLIMQKSCHDMDLLTWLVDSDADKIVSFGDLRYFRSENAPEGAADRCCRCPIEAQCHHSAYKAYLPIRGSWPACVVSLNQSEEGLRRELETSPYGRCVFHCDNNVCDNQVSLIRFKNGVTVSFNLSGFTDQMCRTLKIMCEHGEIRGNDHLNTIEITHFSPNNADEVQHRVIRTQIPNSGHGGGDSGLLNDFLNLLESHSCDCRSSIARSIESHIMACAAEKSRLTGSIVDIDAYKEELTKQCR